MPTPKAICCSVLASELAALIRDCGTSPYVKALNEPNWTEREQPMMNSTTAITTTGVDALKSAHAPIASAQKTPLMLSVWRKPKRCKIRLETNFVMKSPTAQAIVSEPDANALMPKPT